MQLIVVFVWLDSLANSVQIVVYDLFLLLLLLLR